MKEIAKCDNWTEVGEICIIYVYVDFKRHIDKGFKEDVAFL
jgi:hypothetical protein